MSPGTHTTCLGCLPGFRNPHLVSKQNILFSIFILTSSLYTLCNTRSDGLTSFFSNSCWHPFGYVSLFSLLFRFPNAKYLAISRYRHKHISDLTLPPSPLPGGWGGGRLLLLVNKSVGSSFWTVLHICVESISINA